jgi:NTE family protein
MTKCLAFVLGGGAARGALEVGALRALLEAGFRPDLLVGSSIGAVNAAGLAYWGVDLHAVDLLEETYEKVAKLGLMSSRLASFPMSSLAKRLSEGASHSAREFLVEAGITPELRFADLPHVRLALVAADLDLGQTIIYGADAQDRVLEGVIASMSVQPFFVPVYRDGHCVVDGGTLSSVPIEPAMRLGATEIIALDLNDPRGWLHVGNPTIEYLDKLLFSVMHRQLDLELELAAARGVPVRRVSLRSEELVPPWDFGAHRGLFRIGYETMQGEISRWREQDRAAFPDAAAAV